MAGGQQGGLNASAIMIKKHPLKTFQIVGESWSLLTTGPQISSKNNNFDEAGPSGPAGQPQLSQASDDEVQQSCRPATCTTHAVTHGALPNWRFDPGTASAQILPSF